MATKGVTDPQKKPESGAVEVRSVFYGVLQSRREISGRVLSTAVSLGASQVKVERCIEVARMRRASSRLMEVDCEQPLHAEGSKSQGSLYGGHEQIWRRSGLLSRCRRYF